MSFGILSSGPQATLQAAPRRRCRHLGVPASGPMDALSSALANRLVGNSHDATAIEITLGGFEAQCRAPMVVACTGADTALEIDGRSAELHTAIGIEAGETISVGYPRYGCRSYLAVAGGFDATVWLGSGSTYLPGGVGGFDGRDLKTGDVLELQSPSRPLPSDQTQTPVDCRPTMSESWAIRACPGVDSNDRVENAFFGSVFRLSNRTSRMGGALDGPLIPDVPQMTLPSAAVFPGTVQCPPDGRPFLLMADAQTTGGYPQIAQVIRADRHIMGQIRPGDRVRFLRSDPDAAADILRAKSALFENWLEGPFELV
ncbi:MAG: biotin-dependent carboxyltransferase family protein [Pseudomonadota bacterium]